MIPLPDRDGTIDLVFPTCRSHNTGSGIGSGCRINIAYNKQKPLCVDPALNWLKAAGQAVVGKKQDCRKHTELCQADVNFDFVLDPTGDVSRESCLPSFDMLILLAMSVFYIDPSGGSLQRNMRDIKRETSRELRGKYRY